MSDYGCVFHAEQVTSQTEEEPTPGTGRLGCCADSFYTSVVATEVRSQ
jgi:hypothetical protein